MQEILKEEVSAILNWSVDGCLEWEWGGRGLGTPEVVRSETDEYRKESDVIGKFLEERTTRSPEEKVRATELYFSYRGWCHENSESPVTGTAFGREMTRRGFERIPKPYVHYKHLRLLRTIFEAFVKSPDERV